MWVANAALSILAVGLSIGSAYVIVRRAFGEWSPAIRVGLSVGFAIVGQAFGLLWLPMVIPVGWAAMATSAILVGAAMIVGRTDLDADVPRADQPRTTLRKTNLLNLVLIVLGSVLVYISALAYLHGRHRGSGRCGDSLPAQRSYGHDLAGQFSGRKHV